MFPGFEQDRIEATLTPEGRSLFSIQNIKRGDSGKIIVCSAVNSVGSTSTRVVLTVNVQEERPPPIIVQGPTNQTLPVKSVATLPCKTIGGPIITIAWYRDGIPLVLNDRMNLSQSGTLTISDLNKDEDAGLYTCVGSTRSGKSTWSAFLNIEAPTNPNVRFYRTPEASTFPGQPGEFLFFKQNFALAYDSVQLYCMDNSTAGEIQLINKIKLFTCPLRTNVTKQMSPTPAQRKTMTV